ncbi:MAG TPA: alpha/beta fold hydrolase [Streptosporangiaceae bacterium]|jgi:carboxylesterase|nr:alpha/beta fold hydrolase [Streptosporangiaceae bacterium]
MSALPGALLPGAEPFEADGGPVGVLLCHGFTGSPQSLRPWAEYLAGAGLTVSLPRLPGHGTSWRDLARTGWRDWYAEAEAAFAALAGRCEQVFVFGLSMGGSLALRLAETRGAAPPSRGDEPAVPRLRGLVLVNPSLAPDTRLLRLAPLLRHLPLSVPGIASDIKKPGARELGYDRVPVRAAATLPALWRLVTRDLGQVSQPVLVYRSATDHVVGPASLRVLVAGLPEGTVTVRECPDSYHVAPLDNDAPAIFEGSLAFVRQHAAG